ncbi:MAG: hypothetical protein KY476_20370 [Planctomycetes bacterium]|nr:hypothetical protein [Planctomycetota bacterium]
MERSPEALYAPRSGTAQDVLAAIADVPPVQWKVLAWLFFIAAILKLGRVGLMYWLYRAVHSSTEQAIYYWIYVFDVLLCVALGSSSALFLFGIAPEWVLLIGGGAVVVLKVIQLRVASRFRPDGNATG